eukprot:TRINITY_DN30013_c0_g2_i2.p1 TRINITY_DN30013_c0_g2~~TRINITY_DN30013_c0_g2_i2.p1  ORF type:complete len:628 (-),score=91.60 TRINITY_DN30013_c0_g2_i2:70-1953(-)
MAASDISDLVKTVSCEDEGGVVPQGLLRSWEQNHKVVIGTLALRLSYAPPLAGGAPVAVLYVLDPEPELFALSALHIFSRAGQRSDQDFTSQLHLIGVVGVGHHPSCADGNSEVMHELRQRDFLQAPKGELGMFMDALCSEVVPHAERHLGCELPLLPSRRAVMGCSFSCTAALRMLLLRPGVFGNFALGSPYFQVVPDCSTATAEESGDEISKTSVFILVGAESGNSVSLKAQQMADELQKRGVRVSGVHVLAGEDSSSLKPSFVSRTISWLEDEWSKYESQEARIFNANNSDNSPAHTPSSTTTLPPAAASPARPLASTPERAAVADLSVEQHSGPTNLAEMPTAEKLKLMVAFSHPDVCKRDIPPRPPTGPAPVRAARCAGHATSMVQHQGAVVMTQPAATHSPCIMQATGHTAVTASHIMQPAMPEYAQHVQPQPQAVRAGGYNSVVAAVTSPAANSVQVSQALSAALPPMDGRECTSRLPCRAQSFSTTTHFAQGSPAAAVQPLHYKQARTHSFALQPQVVQTASAANPRTRSFAVSQQVRSITTKTRTQSFALHQQVLHHGPHHGPSQAENAVVQSASFSASGDSHARLMAMQRAVVDSRGGYQSLQSPQPGWQAYVQHFG